MHQGKDAYDGICVWPPFRQIAWGNILKFRKKNWRFDVIGGLVYFILVFSMFPQVREVLTYLLATLTYIFVNIVRNMYKAYMNSRWIDLLDVQYAIRNLVTMVISSLASV